MPTNLVRHDFVERRPPSSVPDSPLSDQDIEEFKARVLAKLTLAVGKDASGATDRDWFVATALALRDRIKSAPKWDHPKQKKPLIYREYLRGWGPDRRRLGPHQTVFFKFNTKYLCGIGVGFRFDADSHTALSTGPSYCSWSVVVACAQAPDGAKVYRWNFTAQVRDGSFLGQYNQPGSIPSGTLSGQIQPTVNAHLTMDGLTGDPDYSLRRVHAGTPIHYTATAQFTARSGTGTRDQARHCDPSLF